MSTLPTERTAQQPALRLELEDGVAIVTMDVPGAPVNTLSRALAAEFAALLDRLESDDAIRAAVLLSGKADSWIVGADIDELGRLRSAAEGEALAADGQRLLDRLAALPKPVVAGIHGTCLGGGLEVALACRWRVLTDHPSSVCGLPEVQLGLIPGAGGTQRLPRLVGLQAALDGILTGKRWRPAKARKLGLIDDLVHPAIVRRVATQRARELADGTRRRVAREKSTGGVLLEDNALGRKVVFRKARERVLAKTGGNYPAPLAALEVIRVGYADGMTAGLALEAKRFGELAVTPVCRELTYLFHASTALKKARVTPDDVAPRDVTTLGVVGAGFMGSGIAAVASGTGTRVRLRDASWDRVAAGLAVVREEIEGRRRKRRLTAREADDRRMLVTGTTGYDGFAKAELVIEAVFEDLGVKHAVLAEVEAAAPGAVFASNTSTIPIAEIARAAARPGRVLGMHFFSPVPKMPLLEVIVTDATENEALATAVAYGRRLGKTVIVVRDGPGFYVNRILAPYLNEAGRLLDDGVPVERVDEALTRFGFPVGPLTLLDEVGLDVAGKSGAVLLEAFGERMAPSVTLQRVVESGRTGRKGRAGFYTYDAQGKRGDVDPEIARLAPAEHARRDVSDAEIQARCVLPMVNEAVRCLDEGIIRSPRDGDIGAVFGIGFAPFRGGPFRHLDALGTAAALQSLDALNERFPGRFVAADGLRARAGAGERFHGADGATDAQAASDADAESPSDAHDGGGP